VIRTSTVQELKKMYLILEFTMQLLNRLGICVADYDLDDELETLENL
jgi:hypothetical protein